MRECASRAEAEADAAYAYAAAPLMIFHAAATMMLARAAVRRRYATRRCLPLISLCRA